MRIIYSILAFAFLVSTGCKTPVGANSSDTKIIFGDDDLRFVDLELLDKKWNSVPAAVGYFKSATKMCTATHIGHGLILTAGHCLTQEERFPDDPNQCLPGRSVTFGMLFNRVLGPTANCVINLWAEENIDRDVALLKVDVFPSTYIQVDLQKNSLANHQIALYSHPEGKDLHWSSFCGVIETEQCRTFGSFGYMCDTLSGSSGALVLSDAYGPIPVGVGIHMGPSDDSSMNCASSLSDPVTNAKIRHALAQYYPPPAENAPLNHAK